MFRIFTFIVTVTICLYVHAQISTFPIPVENAFELITDKNKDGQFKVQKVKGKVSGMGVYRFKNGSLYIGDFVDKAFHGLGMYIPTTSDSISNCPDAAIYVGRFKNGLKNGKGKCYNKEGELIYHGRFKDDIPVESYPQSNLYEFYFSDLNSDDFYFLGEYSADYPNGFGTFFFKNGDVYLTNFKEGVQDGICVYIKSDGNWFSEKQNNGESTPISSSEEYASLVRQSKANFRAGLSQALGYFAEAAQLGVQMTEQIQTINTPVYSDTNFCSSKSSSSSNNRSGNTGEKYNLSEQQSYNRDKSIYHKYDGMLSSAFAGNRSASKSEIESWQSKMRSLREKWEKKGRDFPHFPNEDR